MKTSEVVNELYAALAKAQAKFPAIHKDKTATLPQMPTAFTRIRTS